VFNSKITHSNPRRPKKLKDAILYIKRNPKVVKSITSFPYIAKSF